MTIDPEQPPDLKWLVLLNSKNFLISLQAGASHDYLAMRLIELRKQEAVLMGKERIMLDPYLWRILINRLANRKTYEIIDTAYQSIRITVELSSAARFLSMERSIRYQIARPTMWQALNHGDKVSVGDTLRYRSNSNSQPLEAETYLVVKIDQHYFEIIKKGDDPDPREPPRRKAVRYLDVGYNVLIERWSEHQKTSVTS